MAHQPSTTKVTKSDMPVSCPPKDSPAWDMHPRVYIELSNDNKGVCPYCGNEFEIVEE